MEKSEMIIPVALIIGAIIAIVGASIDDFLAERTVA